MKVIIYFCAVPKLAVLWLTIIIFAGYAVETTRNKGV
jgi:hypothetical protein